MWVSDRNVSCSSDVVSVPVHWESVRTLIAPSLFASSFASHSKKPSELLAIVRFASTNTSASAAGAASSAFCTESSASFALARALLSSSSCFVAAARASLAASIFD